MTTRVRVILAALAFAALAAHACAATVPRVEAIRLGPPRAPRGRATRMRVFDRPPAEPYAEVAVVEARLTGGDVRRARAVRALLDRARAYGADGITSVAFARTDGFLVATAIAVRITAPSTGN